MRIGCNCQLLVSKSVTGSLWVVLCNKRQVCLSYSLSLLWHYCQVAVSIRLYNLGVVIMSIIDNAGHSVVTYDGKNKPFTGQRLAKFSWKTVTDKTSALCGIKRDSKCVSLPMISDQDIASNLLILTPHIATFLHGAQDKIIREILEERNSVSTVTTDSISIAAICEWLDGNDESGRLTKESVATWFKENVEEMLTVALADKLGVSETPTQAESDRIIATVEVFRSKVAALAGGKTSYEPKICKSLISALELAPAGDALATRFTSRLNKMIADSIADEELLFAL